MNPKLYYFLSSASKLWDSTRLRCPSCASPRSHVVQRKYGVTALRRCDDCALQFRTPTMTSEESAAFYQTDYSHWFTTEMPSDPELQALLRNRFEGHEKDYSGYIAILTALGAKP